jgi:two-component system, OmpR family, sensor kinase
MRRLSIRARLALVVGATLGVVLFAVGVYVYERVAAQLNEPIAAEVREHTAGLHRMLGRNEPLGNRGPAGTQVVDARGRVMSRGLDTQSVPLITAAEARATLRTGSFGPVNRDHRRLRATVGHWRGQRLVAVSTASLVQREHALRHLRTELILGGLAGMLASALAAYLIARRAFRPFETMRRQAAAISAAEPGGRLAIPRSDDELTRLAETLNDMLDRLERALAHERRFVAEASHELRTPLAVLRAELELARARPRSPEEMAAALESVAEEADRLTRLADDLLVLARADQGASSADDEVDAAELLETVATRFEGQAREQRRTIAVSAADGVTICGDRSGLHRALTNLVDNALRYGAGTIRLEARARNHWVELHVSDDGAGFPDDFLPVAFERFSRAGGERSPDGTGLGLALVRAVAAAHGGTAEADRGVHGGADVWLVLPLEARSRMAAGARPSPRPGGDGVLDPDDGARA